MNVTATVKNSAMEIDQVTSEDVNHCLLFDFVIEGAFMGLCVLFGFIGNTLSIVCLRRDKYKSATPFLLISLALADTLFLATALILRVFTSFQTYTEWFSSLMPYFPYMGTFLWPVALIAETASVYLTVLVTLNRYISVCRPYEASNMCSLTMAKKHVMVITVLSIAYNFPRFFEYTIVSEQIENNNQTFIRAIQSEMGRSKPYIVVYSSILYILVMFAIPLITLIFLNCKLIKALRKAKQRRSQLLRSASDSKNEDDTTLMLIFVVVFFVICKSPALVTQVLLSSLEETKRMCPTTLFHYERISDLFVVANSSLNFIVYCFCSRRFRRILISLCCDCALSRRESVVSTAPPRASSVAPPQTTKLVCTKDTNV